MRCEHCGWDGDPAPKTRKLVDWPEGLPDPPPLPEFVLHPPDRCPFSIRVGDSVFWAGGNPDRPPVAATFIRVTEIQGPDFVLNKKGRWVMTNRGGDPSLVIIKIGEEEKAVPYAEVEQVSKWPVLMP